MSVNEPNLEQLGIGLYKQNRSHSVGIQYTFIILVANNLVGKASDWWHCLEKKKLFNRMLARSRTNISGYRAFLRDMQVHPGLSTIKVSDSLSG